MWPSATNNDMSVTYKDIDQLSQKSAVAGTEKIPVSDTQYLTPAQIATSKQVHLTDESDMPASPDASTLYLIDDDAEVFVSTSQQSLTSAQQAQARTNIGAAATSDIPTTVASMTDASNYPKYVLLADEAAYTALATKDSGTLYLIPKTS